MSAFRDDQFVGGNPFADAGICPCGVVDDLDYRGYCTVCAAAPHDRECICDDCDNYWTAVQNGVDPKSWRSVGEETQQ